MATPALFPAPVRALVVEAGAEGEPGAVGAEGLVPLVNDGTRDPEGMAGAVPAGAVGAAGTETADDAPGTTMDDDAATAEEAGAEGAEVKVWVRVQGQLVMVKVVAELTVKVWLPSVKVVEPGQKVV
jgi:hypothetical protein